MMAPTRRPSARRSSTTTSSACGVWDSTYEILGASVYIEGMRHHHSTAKTEVREEGAECKAVGVRRLGAQGYRIDCAGVSPTTAASSISFERPASRLPRHSRRSCRHFASRIRCSLQRFQRLRGVLQTRKLRRRGAHALSDASSLPKQPRSRPLAIAEV